MDKHLLNAAREWKMSTADMPQKIELDKKRIQDIEELFKDFMPWISQYRSPEKLNIGYELAESYHNYHYVSIIFRDINLCATKSIRRERLNHIRVGRDYEGNFTYYLEFSPGAHPEFPGRTDSGLNKVSSFVELLKVLAEEFGKLGIYTEDEWTVRDIIT